MTFVTPILVRSLGGLGPSGAERSGGVSWELWEVFGRSAAHIGKICKLVNDTQHVMGIRMCAGVSVKLWLINTKFLRGRLLAGASCCDVSASRRRSRSHPFVQASVALCLPDLPPAFLF